MNFIKMKNKRGSCYSISNFKKGRPNIKKHSKMLKFSFSLSYWSKNNCKSSYRLILINLEGGNRVCKVGMYRWLSAMILLCCLNDQYCIIMRSILLYFRSQYSSNGVNVIISMIQMHKINDESPRYKQSFDLQIRT